MLPIFKDIFQQTQMFIPKCVRCCQHKLGMFVTQSAPSSSPKSGQFSEQAPRNHIVCIIHNAGSKINSCSSPAKLRSPARSPFWHREFSKSDVLLQNPEAASRLSGNDNEVATFGPETTTWEPFWLGGSCVQIQGSRGRKASWHYCMHQGGSVEALTTERHASGGVRPPPPTPVCQPWRPPGLT